MTKRTMEEIREDIKATDAEARYWYKISYGKTCVRDWEAFREAGRLFRRVKNLKMELNRAKIRDWGIRAKEPRKKVN